MRDDRAASDSGSLPRTVREVLPVAAAWLSARGIDDARLDTELLLAHALGCRRLDLYTDHDRPVDDATRERFRALMRRRAEREPVAYVVGERGFRGIALRVTPAVLVPRPETELLVEVALERLAARPERPSPAAAPRVADACTGSGCVALALLHEAPAARAVATDVSAEALAVAATNAAALGLADRLLLCRADLLAPLGAGTVDVVVANPPYVTPDEETLLSPEVLREPRRALFDAPGLPLTRRLAAEAHGALVQGGLFAVETGAGKAELVASFLREAGFGSVRTHRDLAGIERVVTGERG